LSCEPTPSNGFDIIFSYKKLVDYTTNWLFFIQLVKDFKRGISWLPPISLTILLHSFLSH